MYHIYHLTLKVEFKYPKVKINISNFSGVNPLSNFRGGGLADTSMWKAKESCRGPGASRGPSDLRPDALPTELSRLCRSWQPNTYHNTASGIPGSPADSGSRALPSTSILDEAVAAEGRGGSTALYESDP